MKTLRDALAWAERSQSAVGHFNISTIEALWGIVHAAKALELPVIIGVSEGERDFLGVHEARSAVDSIREHFYAPVFLNADHTYSFERCKEAIDAGYDSVIFDGAKLSLEENIATTKKVVEYARASGRDVLVEGELGYIGTSSQVLDSLPAGAALSPDSFTTVDDALKFVHDTGVDLFSPAIGSVHGMLRTVHDPDLDSSRIRGIAAEVKVPLVLHGASGLTDETIQAGIEAGLRIAHVNTELRVAWRNAVKLALQEHEDEVAPYKILRGAYSETQKVVEKKLRLFAHLS